MKYVRVCVCVRGRLLGDGGGVERNVLFCVFAHMTCMHIIFVLLRMCVSRLKFVERGYICVALPG